MDWAAIRAEGLANFTMAVMPPTIQLPALPHAVTLLPLAMGAAAKAIPVPSQLRVARAV